MEYVLGILVIAVLLLLIVMVILWLPGKRQGNMKEIVLESEKRQQNALYQLQQHMNEELMYFQNQLTQSLKQDLNQLNTITSDRLFSIEKNVNANLTHGYETTSQVFGKVLQQMGKLDESQGQLKELSASISSLQGVLTDKKTRGIYGEIELYSILSMAMGDNEQRYGKQVRLSTGSIADAVIYASEPLGQICIDSKFPLENYNRLIDEQLYAEERRKAKASFIQDVKKQIKAIAEKYIIPNETADFAYMFIPAEAVFSYLHASCLDIIRYSYEQKVYLVSPTTLMAYITAMKAIYIGQQRNENVLLIQNELKNLQVEFERFEKRYTVLGNDFEKCYQDMKALQITSRKLLNRFKQIADVEIKEE